MLRLPPLLQHQQEQKQLEQKNATKLMRYHHPSHPHKLFQNIVRNMSIFCNNLNCKRRLGNNEVSYVCFRCDFDLCAHCFFLPTEPSSIVQLDEIDSKINDDVLFRTERFPLQTRTVRTVDVHDDEEDIFRSRPFPVRINQPNNNVPTLIQQMPSSTSTQQASNQQAESVQPMHQTSVESFTFESPEYDSLVTDTVTDLVNSLSPVITLEPRQ